MAHSPSTNHASSQVHEVETIEGVIDDQVVDEGQAINDSDKLGEADPYLNENHVSITEESLPTSSQEEDAPKKSYASILSSLTKKNPTKVYVPTNTVKVSPAKIVKQPVNDAEPPTPESSSPIVLDIAPEIKDTQDEGILFS